MTTTIPATAAAMRTRNVLSPSSGGGVVSVSVSVMVVVSVVVVSYAAIDSIIVRSMGMLVGLFLLACQ